MVAAYLELIFGLGPGCSSIYITDLRLLYISNYEIYRAVAG